MTAGTRKSFPAFRMKMCGPFDIRPVSLTAEAIKCVVRTCRDIKTGWCSPRRIADFGMAPAWKALTWINRKEAGGGRNAQAIALDVFSPNALKRYALGTKK